MVKVATKTCSKCHACKPVALFWKKRNQCKVCRAAIKRKCYQKNKEKVAAYKREYYQKNKEKVAAYKREYYQTNKEKLTANQREHYQQNKEEILAYQRKYQQNNKDKIAAYQRKYQHEYKRQNKEKFAAYQREYIRQRRRLDPEFNLLCRLRNRMYKAVKAAGLDNKYASSSELLGISPQGLKEWLEAQFTEGMTWENRSDWHVDHRVPCDAFDLTVDQNQRICFWYKNLQPMWAKDNIQKSNTYTEEEKQALISAYCNQ